MFFIRRPRSDLPDAELVKQYQHTGDTETIGELFQRHTHIVYGVCLKLLKDEEDGRDAVMDIFGYLHDALLVHDVTNFRSWIYSVTKNHCLLKIRKRERLTIRSYPNEDLEKLNQHMENPHFLHLNIIGERDFSREDIYNALKKLNEQQRTCIELFFLDGNRYQEIANITGYSLNAVKSHIQNGKRNLKKLLMKE